LFKLSGFILHVDIRSQESMGDCCLTARE